VLLDSSSVFFDQKEMQNKVLEEIRTNILCLIHYSKNNVSFLWDNCKKYNRSREVEQMVNKLNIIWCHIDAR